MGWRDVGKFATYGGPLSRFFDDDDYENPADAASPYFDKIPGEMEKRLNPYIDAGNRQLPNLERQYGELTNDPGSVLNRIGGGYQKSPGFDFALKQALQASGNHSAAGGMATSPQASYQKMDLATNLANQDYNSWLQNALKLYGMGTEGEEGLYGKGFQGSEDLASGLAQVLGAQGQLAYSGVANRNAHRDDEANRNSQLFGNLAGAESGAFF